MINGFDEHTHELNPYELNECLPAMVKGLRTKIGEKNAITSTQAIKLMKERGFKISGSRFRKIINHIRIHGLLMNLVSTSRGYYIATTVEDCEQYIESLAQRIRSITAVHDAMEWQLNQAKKNRDQPRD